MATVTKDFKVKAGLIVEGANGTINGADIVTAQTIENGAAENENITVTYDAQAKKLVFVAENGVADSTTDDLVEGATNLYFTDERAQDAVGAMLSENTESGISVTYDDETNKVNFDVNDPLITISGDVDGSATMTNLGDTEIQVTLDTVNSNVGSFGGQTKIPTFTVNGKGLLTAAGEVDVATNLSIAGDSGTDTVSLLTDTLTFVGEDGITIDVTDNTVTANVNVATGLEVSGSGDIQIDSTVVTLDGTQTLSNKTLGTNLDADENKIVNLATPTEANDAANKVYVDSVAQGLDVKQSVRLASTGNVANLGTVTAIDGISLNDGDRVLLKNQTDLSENGIYVHEAGSLTRSADADAPNEMNAGTFVFVEEGDVHADTGWVVSSDNPLAIGTDPITWTQFSGAGTYLAGYGLTLTGNTFAVDDDEIVNHTELNTAVSDLTDYIDGFLDPSTGTTVEYIDQQDAATLLAANGYSDALVAAGDPTATPTYLAIDINSVARQVAATASVPPMSETTVYSFLKTEYRSAKFLVKVAYGTHTQISEVLLTLDTSDNIAVTEFAMVSTNGFSYNIFPAVIDNDIVLKVSPSNMDSITATATVVGTLLV